jgi:hypothetical protein
MWVKRRDRTRHDAAEMRDTYLLFNRHIDPSEMKRVYERLRRIEDVTSLDWLAA